VTVPPSPPGPAGRRLLLFTKPARAGRVKTRLIGDLTPRQAADLHAAFLGDLLARLRGGRFELHLAWALEPGEEAPPLPFPVLRQDGKDLGERLHRALAWAAGVSAPAGAVAGTPQTAGAPAGAGSWTPEAAGASPAPAGAPVVAALGSDHPTLPLAVVERAFELVESGAPVVLGPAEDGGYYLIALAARAVSPRLFEDIPWSTGRVLSETLARCAELGLGVELLPPACDVDTPLDLTRLAGEMAAGDLDCPRTRALLAGWRRLPAPAAAAPAIAAPATTVPPAAFPAVGPAPPTSGAPASAAGPAPAPGSPR
jgi:glycosyltransferase A (GT-A) superfamily protein (DUF2064 family)